MNIKKLKSILRGDRSFYRMVLAVALPIMAQNGITQFVNMLDNVMVGSVGTEPMSGVAICNSLIFVFNLCIFGGFSGAGIYGAQFYGKEDDEGVRNVFRFKIWTCILIIAVGMAVLSFFAEPLISAFLHDGSREGDLEATLAYGKAYMKAILWSLPPYALSQVYSSTLRECRETILPMRASIVAVFINLVGNWILIYGKLGAPALGVVGAAIATTISRYVELAIIAGTVHGHITDYPYFMNVYSTLRVPRALAGTIMKQGMPLLANEALWSSGTTLMTQAYSTRGLAVVAAWNIASTINNIFIISLQSMGNAVGIIVGNLLGAGKFEEAKETDARIIAFSVELCMVMGFLMLCFARVFPRVYNTSEEVRGIATGFIIVMSCAMPFHSYCNGCYFTLRSGGLTRLTMLFDCGFLWAMSLPLAFVLSRFTDMPILPLYICVCCCELIKCILGAVFLGKGKWVRNIVADSE